MLRSGHWAVSSPSPLTVMTIWFWISDNCNETLGFHPCMDGTCYEEEHRCDGSWFCPDGQDEMGCKHRGDWERGEDRKRVRGGNGRG